MKSRQDKGEGKDMGGEDVSSRYKLNTEQQAEHDAWKASHDAARAKQRGTTGVYNPKTGEREYGGFHTGPKKDMQGRRYRG